MWEALGQLGSGMLSWTLVSPQHRKPNAGQRANNDPDCAVGVATQLGMGSGMHVQIMLFKEINNTI